MGVNGEFDRILKKFDNAKNNSYYVNRLFTEFMPVKELMEYTGTDSMIDAVHSLNACGTWFAVDDSQEYSRIVASNFCRRRICPMCQFRKSEKMFTKMMSLCERMESDGYRFLHLVLTLPNATTNAELVALVSQLNTLSTKLFKFKGYIDSENKVYSRANSSRNDKKIDLSVSWKGQFRACEITYNYANDTYHPHLHCLVAVKRSYFNNPKYYISHAQLKAIWEHIAHMDNLQVSLGAIKTGNYKGVAEVCKYSLKPLQINREEQDNAITDLQNWKFIQAIAFDLKGKRLTQRFGIIKEYWHKLYGADDEKEDIEESTENNGLIHYFWDNVDKHYVNPNESEVI